MQVLRRSCANRGYGCCVASEVSPSNQGNRNSRGRLLARRGTKRRWDCRLVQPTGQEICWKSRKGSRTNSNGLIKTRSDPSLRIRAAFCSQEQDALPLRVRCEKNLP